MTLAEKVAFIGLQPVPSLRVEQENPGDPRICVPPLVLRDGPSGLAYGATGVTAFPSELNVAASFDPRLAGDYGFYLGAEARGQGVMALQGPGLDVSVFDNWGRSFENLGEDPTLTSQLGAAIITGIQSAGEIAMAKHLGIYAQETARGSMDDVVSARAAQELYLAPFRVAAQAGVSSVMCAIGRVNGTENCSDAATIAGLVHSGFRGFIRTDAGASSDEVAALKAGVDLFRPYDPAPVSAAVADGTLPLSVLNRAVRDVLTVMFRSGDMQWPGLVDAGRKVSGAGAASTSLRVAESSTVLLRNDGVLPLSRHHAGSIAVIGAAASQAPVLAGTGSSQVVDPHPTTDLAGITAVAGAMNVTYTPATSALGATTLALGTPDVVPSLPGYQEAPLSLPTTLTGLVDFSYSSVTPVRLMVDGSPLLENLDTTSGRPVTFERATLLAPGPHDVVAQWPTTAPVPQITAQPVDPLIDQAAAAARRATTAIVVVGSQEGEGYDRATLALAGYQDQLVEAVAAANPRTIVVVHSGGPVLMPWLHDVAAVLEAWYPGQVAGIALGAVLTGEVNPSGRLPVAFPTSDAAAPMIPAAAWPTAPNTADLVALGDLGVGSRWYAAHRVAPLFPFGFGLSYTSFDVSAPFVRVTDRTVQLRCTVTNVGARAGRYVAIATASFPPVSGEPPDQLKGFGAVYLAPGEARTVTISIPTASLQIFDGTWHLVPGLYSFDVAGASAAVHLRHVA